MIFDLDFFELEFEAVRTGTVPPELFQHRVFRAIAFHESELDRPPLEEETFCAYLREAAQRQIDPREPGRLMQLTQWLKNEEPSITREIARRMAAFTAVQPPEDLRCVLYAFPHDGGFQIGYEHTVYLNIAAFTTREELLQTLTHESYHGRALIPKAQSRIRRLEDENDYIGAVLYFTFEEGIADLIGMGGNLTTDVSVIPLRSPQEGTAQLQSLLWEWKLGAISAEELYKSFRQTDCCYTAGVWIARCVWDWFGPQGLDRWSEHCDYMEFYKAFRTTAHGADWPEL